MRVRSKICGITRLDDALLASSLGADALGFVFFEPSPRNISPEDAAKIISELPAFVTSVGLFVNADAAFVAEVIQKTGIDLLQFHGDESVEFCEQFDRPYIKAVRVRSAQDLDEAFALFKSAQGILADAYVKGVAGGTGQQFDWDVVPEDRPLPLILAGGLKPENVRNATKAVRPWAVDVSGGVEASKGVKDSIKLGDFLSELDKVSD